MAKNLEMLTARAWVYHAWIVLELKICTGIICPMIFYMRLPNRPIDDVAVVVGGIGDYDIDAEDRYYGANLVHVEARASRSSSIRYQGMAW